MPMILQAFKVVEEVQKNIYSNYGKDSNIQCEKMDD